jgi:hypothetical protein
MKRGSCVDCKATFYSSAYWFEMKKSPFPDRCCNCRYAERAMLRGTLEEGIEGVEGKVKAIRGEGLKQR